MINPNDIDLSIGIINLNDIDLSVDIINKV